MLNTKKLFNKILSWITGDSSATALGSYCHYIKKNGTVLLTGSSSGMALTTSYQVIGTLPSGYRPDTLLYFSASTTAASNHVFGYVDTDGRVGIRSASNASLFWVFTLTFPVGGVIKNLINAARSGRGWACA